MKIYIEYKGAFYDYGFQNLDGFLLEAKYGNKAFFDLRKVEKPDFEIGDRVYFEEVGWAEAVEGTWLCTGCIFHPKENVFCEPSPPICNNKEELIFQKIKEVEKEEIKGQEINVTVCEKAASSNSINVTLPSGIKHDTGKLRPGLFPMDCFEEIAKVLTYGANKYAPDNWKQVEPKRYNDALWRHWIAHKKGETVDAESGLLHLAHFATNAIFLLWFELHKNDSKGTEQKSEDFPGANRV